MKIVIDGNDGTGKTSLVAKLKALGMNAQDRGVPTRMTDDPSVKPIEGEFYFILDVPVHISRKRLQRAGKSLKEKYHTVEDLTFYRAQFLRVAESLGPDWCRVLNGREKTYILALQIQDVMNRRGLLKLMSSRKTGFFDSFFGSVDSLFLRILNAYEHYRR